MAGAKLADPPGDVMQTRRAILKLLAAALAAPTAALSAGPPDGIPWRMVSIVALRLSGAGLVLQRLDTAEYGVVPVDKREALLALCTAQPQVDPATVRSWHPSRRAAVSAARAEVV